MANEATRFEEFWAQVARAKMAVCANGHKGCPFPSTAGDPWDDAFAAAYQAVKPYLLRLRPEQLFFPPPGMPWRSVPITAETAHQALMKFLNPPQEVYGFPDLLTAPEYTAIKAAALAELVQREKDRECETRRSTEASPDFEAKARILRIFLYQHHKSQNGEAAKEPLTQVQIAETLKNKLGPGWSQSTVHRLMEHIFPERLYENPEFRK